ncbi:transposase [Deinococcus rhizophilus]
MTSLPKEGKFPLLGGWTHRFNGVTGVHLVVLYICCGEVRLPWSFLIWRGKHQTSPAELALKMLARLPVEFRKGRTALHVLADAGFSGRKFIAGVLDLGLTVSVSIQANKVMDTGLAIRQVRRQGQAIFLKDLPQIPLWLYWVWLPTKTGRGKEKRYVVSTVQWTPSTIRKKGRRRWRIEALFKTLKSRFGLHRFGQQTRRGVLRYFCLCLLSFLLCHFQDLEDVESGHRTSPWPDWGELAGRVRVQFCGLVRLAELEAEILSIRTVLEGVLRL